MMPNSSNITESFDSIEVDKVKIAIFEDNDKGVIDFDEIIRIS